MAKIGRILRSYLGFLPYCALTIKASTSRNQFERFHCTWAVPEDFTQLLNTIGDMPLSDSKCDLTARKLGGN